MPVAYVNSLSASDLADGSKSVKVDGNPTALESKSYVSTSTGDEAGTQGGNVITHKTKGKGYFKTWSFTVKVENKGVCRHDDMMGQNCMSSPPGCVDMKAVTRFLLQPDVEVKPCPDSKPYKRTSAMGPKDPAQYDAVKGGPCWECVRDMPKHDYAAIEIAKGVVAKASAYVSGRKVKERFTPDHQPPLNCAWYLGGCHMQPSPEAFEKWASSPQAVKPHCATHSSSQGGTVGAVTSGKSGQDAFDACSGFMWG
jgi:hypothetical protein